MAGLSTQPRAFEGMRAVDSQHRFSAGSTASSSTTCSFARRPLRVVAQRKVAKKQQVVLTQEVPGWGKQGDLTKVPMGYFRNYLLPEGKAVTATTGILAKIQKQIDDENRSRREEKAKAQAMATALSTIGKFIVRKKVGKDDQIFGSVTAAEIIEAIAQQTGRTLDKKGVVLPDIKTTGTFDASIRLHPEVVGDFKVVVQREKEMR